MNIKRDKYLTEAMGLCWHEEEVRIPYHDGAVLPKCRCGASAEPIFIGYGEADMSWGERQPDFVKAFDFSTWQGFGMLWEWSQKQDWWDGFMYAIETEYLEDALGYPSMAMVDWFPRIIHPDRFADTLYEFLKGREG